MARVGTGDTVHIQQNARCDIAMSAYSGHLWTTTCREFVKSAGWTPGFVVTIKEAKEMDAEVAAGLRSTT